MLQTASVILMWDVVKPSEIKDDQGEGIFALI